MIIVNTTGYVTKDIKRIADACFFANTAYPFKSGIKTPEEYARSLLYITYYTPSSASISTFQERYDEPLLVNLGYNRRVGDGAYSLAVQRPTKAVFASLPILERLAIAKGWMPEVLIKRVALRLSDILLGRARTSHSLSVERRWGPRVDEFTPYKATAGISLGYTPKAYLTKEQAKAAIAAHARWYWYSCEVQRLEDAMIKNEKKVLFYGRQAEQTKGRLAASTAKKEKAWVDMLTENKDGVDHV